MSIVVSGVASIWSKSLLYFSLKKKLNVESSSAPFIAEAASMPGRDELGVRDGLAVELEAGDQLADADADREQVEDRLEEAGDEDLPGAAVGEVVAVEQQPGGLGRGAGTPRRGRRAVVSMAISRPASGRAGGRRSNQPTTREHDEVGDVDGGQRPVDRGRARASGSGRRRATAA